MVIRRDHGPSLPERLGHAERPRRHPLRDEPVDGRRRWRHPGRRAERRHDVTAVGPTVGGQGDHPGEAVLVERGRGPARRGRPLELQAAADRVGLSPPEGLVSRRRAAPGALAGRVAAQAMRAPRPECTPVSSMWRRMSALRVENSASSSGPTPATSAVRPGRAGPAHAEGGGQSGAQMRLVDRRGGLAMGGDAPPVTGAPAPVRSVHEVGHHHVAVEVRVAVPADSVREHRREGPAGGQHGTRAGPDRRVAVMACCSRYESDPATASACAATTVPRRVGTSQSEEHAGRLRAR